MNTRTALPIVITLFGLLGTPSTTRASTVKAATEMATEAFERLGKLWGQMPPKAATEALQTAIKAEGEAAVRAAERGGVALSEAAAVHGGEVFGLAARVPESTAALAAHADTLLPLARRYGDDVLRIEAKAPGLGSEAALQFGSEAQRLADLVRLKQTPLQKVLILGSHIPSQKARNTLLETALRQGDGFLTRLSPEIVRTGRLRLHHLALAALAGALASHTPSEVLHVMGSIAGGLFGWLLAALSWVLALVVGLWLSFKLRLFSLSRREWRRWKSAGSSAHDTNSAP